MIEPGTEAPTFELPAADDGEIRPVSLSDYLGEDVVVLAFYPADFSPSCTDELCSLRDLELFDIDRDVTLLGISADSAFSHRAFAERYDLAFPLLSDSAGTVAERYGVRYEEFEGHEGIPKRAVFVVGVRGRVRYAWATDDPTELPDFDALQAAIRSVKDDDTAIERYRDAHDHYRYGTSELESATAAMDDEDWALARAAFDEATWYFDVAADGFDSAAGFGESADVAAAAVRSAEVAGHLRNAADWFEAAASHYDDGNDELGDEARADAREQLETARELEPIEEPPEVAAAVAE